MNLRLAAVAAFLAATLLPATVIGQDSSGGASSIGAIILPNGTALIISKILQTEAGCRLSRTFFRHRSNWC